MKIRVRQNICIGFGDCLKICPQVFKRVEDKTVVEYEAINEISEEACRRAEIMCPVGAISISEDHHAEPKFHEYELWDILQE